MPEIAYLIVNTKITSRFYELTRNSVYNPSSGTVVFDELETNGLYDFYLTPQRVTQGTCTPIHVIVAYTSRVFDQEDLAQFTYEQCFGYYNWSGAVKLPAALQNANKLGKFMG